MTVWSKTRFLLSWWWVGLATFPRTLVQALNLLLKRKLSWAFRPEPRKDTMPRHADPTEILIESLFRKYLRNLVENCCYSIIVNYSPAGLIYGEDERMTSPSAQLPDSKPGILDFKILTPSFYSRFLHYTQDPIKALILEQESATVAISNLELLSKLKTGPLPQEPLNPLEHPRFWAIQNLRTSPMPIENTETSAPPSPTTETGLEPEEKPGSVCILPQSS